MKRAIALIGLAVFVAGCAQDRPVHVKASAQSTTSTSATSTTTTTVPPPTSTTARPSDPVSRSSSSPRPTVPPAPIDAAFWRRLANCESSDGRSGRFAGYFQFSADTAAKVGYRPGLTYEEQRALAITWLGKIHGAGGSRSGWPHCWWVARSG